MADGGLLRVSGGGNIYASAQEGMGWTPAHMYDLERPGNLWDHINRKLVATEVLAMPELREWVIEHDHPIYDVPEHLLLKLPVYNLEVEDFHTYYVGEYGVWVHNQNCGGLRFEQQPSLRE